MSEFKEVLTQDGSYSLRSIFFDENFHSLKGALNETQTKFIVPSDLKRFKNKSLKVLDICFGLGYNSALLFNNLIQQNSSLSWYALELDKRPLEFTLKNKNYRKLWNQKIIRIFESLYHKNTFEDDLFKCKIIWGEARMKIINIPEDIKFDLIYLDGFSPQKCPQVWTVEFLSMVTQKLSKNGYLITYSTAAAVRNTLRNLGLKIYSIKPNLNSKNLWSQGTVGVAKFDEEKIQPNPNLNNLSFMEEEHLLTKASIPYRDPELNAKTEDIISERLKEQLLSDLSSSKIWREKWKMTKWDSKGKI